MIISDLNFEGFHFLNDCVCQDGTFSYVKDDNEDDFIDININPITNMCVIEPHIACSRVYVDVIPFTTSEELEKRIEVLIDKFMK